jgi:hypothetical protein
MNVEDLHITASAVYAVYTFVALLDCAEEFVTLEFEHHEFHLTFRLKRWGYLPPFSHSFTIIVVIVVIIVWHAGTTFLGYCHTKIQLLCRYADRKEEEETFGV